MELEAAAGEVAVDDPVRVGDIGSVPRCGAAREVVVVRPQLPENRRRARTHQALSQRSHLLERDLDVHSPRRWQHTREPYGSRDLRTVHLGGGPGQPAFRHRMLHRGQRCPFAGHGWRCRRSARHDQ